MAIPSARVGGMNNLEYDFTSILYHKSKALKAIETYIKDAEGANCQSSVALLKKIQRNLMEESQEVRRYLKQLLEKGKTDPACSTTQST